jgi:CubicO group peptidase (beta-lactamase class C family)
MSGTSITLSEAQKKRLAPGYDASLKPVKNWDFAVLAGCGAVRSTVNDMLKFVAANLELTETPLKSAMRRMRSVTKETGVQDLGIGLAWHVYTKFDTRIWWHNGGTYGYRSFVGFNSWTTTIWACISWRAAIRSAPCASKKRYRWMRPCWNDTWANTR